MSAPAAAMAIVSAGRSVLTADRRRAIRHGLIVAGAVAAAIVAYRAFNTQPVSVIDAHAYWSIRLPVTYGAAPGTDGAFLYSPAFAHAVAPLTVLPWPLFHALWLAAMLAVLVWLVRPVLLFPAVLLTTNEFTYANIHFFIAALIVIGFRHSWAWAPVLLTKITPGVGLLWFAVRREWRSLAIALVATAAVVAVSFALDPPAWFAWLRFLADSAGTSGHPTAVPGPLWLRLPIAAAVVAWGAHTDRPWTVPLAAVVAIPHGTIGLAMLVAVVPLLRGSRFAPAPRQRSERTAPAPAAAPAG